VNVQYSAAEVLMTVAVEPGSTNLLQGMVASLTSGSAVVEPAGRDWVDEPV
jgi:hypothetical protein